MLCALRLSAWLLFSAVSAFHGATLSRRTGRYTTLDQYKARKHEYADLGTLPGDSFIVDVIERKETEAVQERMRDVSQY